MIASSIRLPTWRPVRSSLGGHHLEVYVLADALKDASGVRFSVTARDVQHYADELGALPTTAKLEDLAWEQADVRLAPQLQNLAKGENDPARHSNRIEVALNGRSGLIRTVGKAWILHPRLGRDGVTAINYGLHDPKAPYTGWSGLKMWQTVGTRHNDQHHDYSQTCACLAFRSCLLDGETRDLEDIMRDPALAELVSYEGSLTRTRLVL